MKKGQTLVEFSLVLVVFLGLMVSIMEWGIYLFALSSISNATRDAARMAVIIEGITPLNIDNIEDQISNEIYRQASSVPVKVRRNIASRTSVSAMPEDATSPEYITVQVTDLEYKSLSGLKVFIPKTISTRATMRYERKK